MKKKNTSNKRIIFQKKVQKIEKRKLIILFLKKEISWFKKINEFKIKQKR